MSALGIVLSEPSDTMAESDVERQAVVTDELHWALSADLLIYTLNLPLAQLATEGKITN